MILENYCLEITLDKCIEVIKGTTRGKLSRHFYLTQGLKHNRGTHARNICCRVRLQRATLHNSPTVYTNALKPFPPTL